MGIHVSEAAIERDGKRAHPLLATNSEHYCDSKGGRRVLREEGGRQHGTIAD